MITLILSLLSASFLRKNELFLLENALNLIHEFLYDISNKKIYEICHTKTHVLIFMHSQGEMVHFFPLNEGTQKRTC